MPSRYPNYRVVLGDDIGDPNFLDSRFRDIDLRLVSLEDIEKDWIDALASLTEVGLSRINEVLRPAYDEISRLAHLGAIFLGHSSTELLLEEGLHRFTIDAEERDTYAPAAYIAAFSAGDPSKALLGRVISFDRETGELDVDVDKISGEGAAADWIVYPSPSSATADDRAAIEAIKDVIQGYVSQCEESRDTSTTNANLAVAAKDETLAANVLVQSAKVTVTDARDQTIAAIAAWDASVLGVHTVAPTTRAGGAALQTGDQYFDANVGVMKWKTWDGTQWTVNAVPAGSEVNSVFGRTGAVSAQANDYRTDQIGRTAPQQAVIAGATAEDALITLKGRDDIEATARANADALKVDKTTTVTGGGLASGGGDLSANRTITVTEASQAEAQAGTASTVVMTPRRTKDAIDQLVPAATTALAGKVQLAGTADGQAGTSTTKVTPVAIVRAMIDAALAAMVGSSPSTLDTLNELAAAIGNDANFSETVTNLIGQKLNASAVSGFMMTVLDDADQATALGTLGAAALSHSHNIADIANLQTTIDAKLSTAAYTAADVLTKIKTVDGTGSGLDADLIRGVTPTTFGLARMADADQASARSGLGLGSSSTYAAGAFAQVAGGQNLNGGFTATSYNAGSISGAFKPNALGGNKQHCTFNGAVTLQPPDNPTTIEIEVTNGASAAGLDTNAFNKVIGGVKYNTTFGALFLFTVIKTNSRSVLIIETL